jgi:hypothetical protein
MFYRVINNLCKTINEPLFLLFFLEPSLDRWQSLLNSQAETTVLGKQPFRLWILLTWPVSLLLFLRHGRRFAPVSTIFLSYQRRVVMSSLLTGASTPLSDEEPSTALWTNDGSARCPVNEGNANDARLGRLHTKNYFLRNYEQRWAALFFSESAVRCSGFFLSALDLVRYQSDSGLKR